MNIVNSCCRVVSQVEYPSLVDLRGLLLDLVAQLLGALSRIRYDWKLLDHYDIKADFKIASYSFVLYAYTEFYRNF